MKYATIGIDPGKSGAVAVIADGNVVKVIAFKEQSIGCTIRDMIFQFEGYDIFAYVEKVGAFPGQKQGVSTAFAFGQAYGEIIGCLDALEVPYRLIIPNKWQKGIYGLPKKKDGPTEHKRALKIKATQLFPKLKPTLATADALLIADWGCRDRSQILNAPAVAAF